MTAAPETRYAKTADGVNIAYQVMGHGPLNVVYVPGWISHLDMDLDNPVLRAFFDGLSSFSRLIRLDKRGTGLSDRNTGPVPLEVRMDDVRAVMDACGSKQAALIGHSEGGLMSLLFAATDPERVTALILCDTTAYYQDQPQLQELYDIVDHSWGEGRMLKFVAPSLFGDDQLRRFVGRFERTAASPGAARTVLDNLAVFDARPVLPLLAVPTLVLHVDGDTLVDVRLGRELAEHIPHAQYVEFHGNVHSPWDVDTSVCLAEIQEFLTGIRPTPKYDRVLATVLLTDIVASTETASALGDRRWRDTLDGHDALVRAELQRFRGREIKMTGDGVLATFDGPARGINCTYAIRDAAQSLGIEIRAGLHSGEVELRGEDIGGMGVHIAARVEALAQPNEVLVSSTVKDLVIGSGTSFQDHGQHDLKGVPGSWRLFAVSA